MDKHLEVDPRLLPSFANFSPTGGQFTLYDKPVPLEAEGVRVAARLPPPVKTAMERRHFDVHGTVPIEVAIRAGKSGCLALPDLATAREYTSLFSQWYHSLKDSPDRLGRAHAAEAKKAVLEVPASWPGGADLTVASGIKPSTGIVPSKEVTGLLMKALDAPAPDDFSVKTGTSHGFPSFGSGAEDHMAHFAWALAIREGRLTIKEFEKRASSAIGLPGLGSFTTLFSRTGPIGKPARIAGWVNDEVKWIGEALGQCSRQRIVRPLGTVYNESCRPEFFGDFWRMKLGPLARHFAFGDAADTNARIFSVIEKHPRWVIRSSDFSNYDDTVPPDLLRWSYSFGTRAPNEHDALVNTFCEIPSLCGPRFRGDTAYLLPRNFGIISGKITTSRVGTQINFAVNSDAWVIAGGASYRDLDADGDALNECQGDDCLLVGPDFDESKYLAHVKRFGLVQKFEEFPIFLRVWHESRGVFHTLGSRANIKNCFRERPAAGRLSETAACCIRLILAERDRYTNMFLAELSQVHPLLREAGIRTVGHARLWLSRNGDAAVMESLAAGKGSAGDDYAGFLANAAKTQPPGTLKSLLLDWSTRLAQRTAGVSYNRMLAASASVDPWAYLRRVASEWRTPKAIRKHRARIEREKNN